MSEEAEEADRVAAAPHPRETLRLVGQEAAERAFLDAHASGRLHHAWLITGPRGVGKATLAWRIARFLLARGTEGPADTVDVPEDHPVARRVASLAEGSVFLLRRSWDDKAKRLKTVITVDEVRRLAGFFGLSRPDGGHRIVIVDAADEMNVQAANALLKVLEEPPRDAILLLVAHRPAALLPTIRSRCRVLRCQSLEPAALAEALAAAGVEAAGDAAALAELSGGSVGEAVRLASVEGPETYRRLVALLDTAPLLDRAGALSLANALTGRSNEARLDVTLRLFDLALGRLARWGASHPPAAEAAPGEAVLAARLAPHPAASRRWAELQQALAARARHARAVNLDPASLLLDMLLKANDTAARITPRRDA
ncbi:DNA polymerase III subunit delta' [Roseitranquillus sediminis]|uniref:DNA polymerase III subunit delta' n=1 Tax=Roseitranquillus sediminis TaxID=2809051 RepID=UPI001D0C52A9|nr:DNA polymerase III subunit delta' [Roseitranquillus sediminis]MBM9594724.1 DNA polymerase III subunit delta' [Roseitranquillus sediminis]